MKTRRDIPAVTLAACRGRAGFLLLEAMLAVFIFSIAALGMGRCVQNCIRAESYRREEALAQRALANYWAQVEMGAIPLTGDSVSEDLKGAWEGMKMTINREAMTLQNEKEQDLFSLYKITLVLTWGRGNTPQVRQMDFIYYQRTQ
jgi:Tfp pilus assembly protein PilV